MYEPLIPVYQSSIHQTNAIEMNVLWPLALLHRTNKPAIHDNSKPVINTLEKKRGAKMEAYSTLH